MDGPLPILIVGDLDAPEMRPVAAALDEHFPGVARRTLPDLGGLRELVDGEGTPPDLVLVAQRFPQEHSESHVMDAIGLLPLARWVCCLGAWCEAAGRTGIAWPLPACVPARSCGGRLLREAAVLRGAADPLPLTAARDETFAFDAPVLRGEPGDATAAAISPDRALQAAVEAILRRRGWRIAATGADLVVVDVDPLDAGGKEQLRAAADRHPGAAILALMSLWRPEDEAALIAAGAKRIVAKLALATDLPDANHCQD